AVVAAWSRVGSGMAPPPQPLREVSWPEEATPAGTSPSIQQLTAGGKRIVLASIEPNEPVLASKITGPGQRATLSAVIAAGMRAVTIRVNDVDGVAGFVLPGDHVDVLLTQHPDKDKRTGNTDVVLQNTKVLAVDQLADDSSEKACGGESGHARGRHGGGPKAFARRLARHAVARPAQGRRGERRGYAAHLGGRPRQRCSDVERRHEPLRQGGDHARVQARGIQRAGRGNDQLA